MASCWISPCPGGACIMYLALVFEISYSGRKIQKSVAWIIVAHFLIYHYAPMLLPSCFYDTAKATRGSFKFLRILLKMCSDLAILPIGSWGEAKMTFEDQTQVALVGKPAR